jgi:hypothetical protein
VDARRRVLLTRLSRGHEWRLGLSCITCVRQASVTGRAEDARERHRGPRMASRGERAETPASRGKYTPRPGMPRRGVYFPNPLPATDGLKRSPAYAPVRRHVGKGGYREGPAGPGKVHPCMPRRGVLRGARTGPPPLAHCAVRRPPGPPGREDLVGNTFEVV